MAERGMKVDHTTLNRWIVKYSPNTSGARSWRVDETYIKGFRCKLENGM